MKTVMNPTKSFDGAPGTAAPEYNPGRSGTNSPAGKGGMGVDTYKSNQKVGMGLPSRSFGTEKSGILQPPPQGMMPEAE